MSMETTTLKIGGMTCVACATRLEKVLDKVPGVLAASVSLASEQAMITGGQPDALVAAVTKAGFTASQDDRIAPETAPWRDVILAALLTLPLVAQMVGGFMLPMGLQVLLASPVQFWCGRRFYTGAWAALRGGTGNMDVLVALGTSAAYGLSVASLFWPLDSYFESAAVVITLVQLGKVLETRARHRAASAVAALMALRPDQAEVEQDGAVRTVPAAQVLVGDVVLVRPGQRFPVDGVVLTGESAVDEALVTGESLPVPKGAGDGILAGSSNGDGLLRVQTTAVGGQSTLGRMVKLVQQAQNSKAKVQKLVDRVSAVFVPVVVAAALATLVGWGLLGQVQTGLVAAIAVLVVACPCALGLATPAAIMVGVGVAARHGLLVKGVGAFEAAAPTTLVVFDKTGTLTHGHPVLSHLTITDPHWNRQRVLALAAGAQQGSEHPIGRALVALAQAEHVALPVLDHFTAQPGRGIVAQVAGQAVLMGTERLLTEQGVVVPAGHGDGIWLVVDGLTVALLQMRDDLRASSAPAVRALRHMGIGVALLTGDRQAEAQRVAATLGIDRVRAQALPADKLDFVAQSCDGGQHVVMVGDGINDAAALKRAHLGIAMGGGTDVALEVADMALLRPDPMLVVTAIRLSRRVMSKIRQNLFWAFCYNLMAVPFAVSGHLSPMIAGAAMALSSVSVVSNALTLRLFRAE